MSDQLTIILITLAGVLTIAGRYALSLWPPGASWLDRVLNGRSLTVTSRKDAWWLKPIPDARDR